MINFILTATSAELNYEGDMRGSNEYVWNELKKRKQVSLSRIFFFELNDLINPPTPGLDLESYVFRFRLGTFEGDYVRIPSRILDIKNDLLIAKEVGLKRKIFVAERNVSIFRRLSDLLETTNPITIGGSTDGSIPKHVFEELLKRFPKKLELDRYADARVHTILAQHLDGIKDARARYESYLNKKSSSTGDAKIDLAALKKLEVEKYTLIKNLVTDALEKKTNLAESEWQNLMLSFLLLLFPKYIKVLKNIKIPDYYSVPGKTTNRFIDIGLVDASGNLDVIEIKKPFDDKILRQTLYRGNSIPTSELSGGIMQAEKYLFHLSKWGVKGEEALTKKYSKDLPAGMTVRISSPKAILIVGRDQIGGAGMTGSQLLDFQVIKRKYANMMDIITYDDLLRRLDNTIAALGV
jgi:hypothetical protein